MARAHGSGSTPATLMTLATCCQVRPFPVAVDTVINVKVILIGLTSEVKRPPLA